MAEPRTAVAGNDEMRMPVAGVLRHAGSVEAAADGMDTGRDAGAQVQLGGDAYGQICGFFPGLVTPLADRAVTALGESAAALRQTAASLRTAAAAAESADTFSAERTSRAGGGIELPL